MRNFLRVLCVCALGVVPLVGCGEAAPCQSDKDCDDQNECTNDTCDTTTGSCFYTPSREWEVCDDGDDNECAYGRCDDGVCTTGTGWDYWEDYEGKPCRSNCTGYYCREGKCVCSPGAWGWCICGL